MLNLKILDYALKKMWELIFLKQVIFSCVLLNKTWKWKDFINLMNLNKCNFI